MLGLQQQRRPLAQLEQGRAALSPAERSLFDRAMYRSRPGTLLRRIRRDIRAGTLPTVVWVVPPAAASEHPGSSTPVGSANLVHDLLDVIADDAEARGSHQEAITAFTATLGQDPHNTERYTRLADHLLALGRNATALHLARLAGIELNWTDRQSS